MVSDDIHMATAMGSGRRVSALIEHDPGLANKPNDYGWTPLHLATERGYVEIIQLLLAKGADVNAALPNRQGTSVISFTPSGVGLPRRQTALHIAACLNDPVVARLLLSAGANPDARDQNEQTPLHHAAICSAVEVAKVLLDAGASVDAGDQRDGSPLHWAARVSPCVEMVRLLLRAGADPNSTAAPRSPLGEALQSGNNEPAEVLREAGAKLTVFDAAALGDLPRLRAMIEKESQIVSARSKGGCTPLAFAVWSQQADAVRLLLDAGSLLADLPEGGTSLLQEAAYDERADIAALLRKAGAQMDLLSAIGLGEDKLALKLIASDPAQVNVCVAGMTPLCMALMRKNVKMVKALLKAGADVNATLEDGRPVLQRVVSMPPFEGRDIETFFTLAKMVLEAGLDLNAAGPDGMTFTHYGAYRIGQRGVPMLLKAGADVTVRDALGQTPLHHAAVGFYATYAVDALLAAGADVNAVDARCETPLDAAICGHRMDAAKILLECGAEVDVFAAVAFGDVNRLRALLDEDQDIVHARLSDRDDALHLAVLEGREDAIRLLVERGADVNARSSGGTMPLHHAARAGQTGAVSALLKAGAEINALSDSGETPLCCAAGSNELSVARLLLEAGADVNAHAGSGRTPLQAASACGGYKMMMKLLKEHGARE